MSEVTLSERYSKLTTDTLESWNKVTEKIDKTYYFCDDEYIKEDIEKTKEYLNDIDEINTLETLYYNDSNGNERACYILAVTVGGFIHVIEQEAYRIEEIELYHFNGLTYKIDTVELVIEKLKEYGK
jgi:hypothetical protein